MSTIIFLLLLVDASLTVTGFCLSPDRVKGQWLLKFLNPSYALSILTYPPFEMFIRISTFNR
jgi:hypothetical protein